MSVQIFLIGKCFVDTIIIFLLNEGHIDLKHPKQIKLEKIQYKRLERHRIWKSENNKWTTQKGNTRKPQRVKKSKPDKKIMFPIQRTRVHAWN